MVLEINYFAKSQPQININIVSFFNNSIKQNNLCSFKVIFVININVQHIKMIITEKDKSFMHSFQYLCYLISKILETNALTLHFKQNNYCL